MIWEVLIVLWLEPRPLRVSKVRLQVLSLPQLLRYRLTALTWVRRNMDTQTLAIIALVISIVALILSLVRWR